MQARSVLRAALYASLLTASCALKLSAVDAGVASVAKLRPSDNKDAFFTAAPRLVAAVVAVVVVVMVAVVVVVVAAAAAAVVVHGSVV